MLGWVNLHCFLLGVGGIFVSHSSFTPYSHSLSQFRIFKQSQRASYMFSRTSHAGRSVGIGNFGLIFFTFPDRAREEESEVLLSVSACAASSCEHNWLRFVCRPNARIPAVVFLFFRDTIGTIRDISTLGISCRAI